MKRANGTGTVIKLSGQRRRPYAVKVTTGWSEKGYQKYTYLSYHSSYRDALKALNKYIDDPYSAQSVKLSELFDEYMEHQDNKSDGTIKAYNTAYRKLEPLHSVKVSLIDRVTLQKFYDRLPGTVNSATNVRKLLQNLFKYAVKRGYMPTSALELHKVIDFEGKSEPKTIKRAIITEEERNHLWELSKESETAKIILFYIYTGLRYAELYELREEYCHPDHIEIVKSKTEAGKRIVPLSDKVLSLLPIETVPEYTTFNKRFKEILPGHHIHDTRHTFITMLTEAGIDKRIVRVLVGHSDRDVTDHYTHIDFSALLDAVNKI